MFIVPFILFGSMSVQRAFCHRVSWCDVQSIRPYLRSSLSTAGNKLSPSADSDVDVTRTAARRTDNSSAIRYSSCRRDATPLSKSLSAPYTTLIASEGWNRWRPLIRNWKPSTRPGRTANPHIDWQLESRQDLHGNGLGSEVDV